MKIYRNVVIAALAIAAAACAKQDAPVVDAPVSETELVEMTFDAGFVDQTKAQLNADATRTVWTSDDRISIFDGSGNRPFVSGGEGESVGFTGQAAEVDSYYALYPYSESASLSEAAIKATIPSVQTAVKGSFDPKAALAVAYAGVEENLGFRNLGSMLKVTVPAGTLLSSIKVEGNAEENIAGDVSVTIEDGLPVITDGENMAGSVTLSGTIDEGVYYIVVRPGDYSGLTVTVTDEKGSLVKKNENPVKLERSAKLSLGTVSMASEVRPAAVFLGITATIEELDPEAKAAATWMLENVKNSAYVPFTALADTDLSECDVMWWHYHRDGSVENPDKLAEYVPDAVSESTLAIMSDYFNNGGNFLLTRYATHYQAKIGAGSAADYYWGPNNCWGDPETGGVTSGGGDGFYCFDGYDKTHPLFAGLTSNDDNNAWKITPFDEGYQFSNSTARYNMHESWSDFYDKDYDKFKTVTGANPLAKDGDQSIVIWEFEKATETRGHVLCIGTPLYDWYSPTGHDGGEGYHANILNLTRNAIDYLRSK